VRSDLRGRNIGRQMMLLLLDRAREAGMDDALLEVRPSNTLAISLYRSMGFVEIGRRRGYYQADGGREDALVLRLTLAETQSPDAG
jgi:ribosomal protein S18 acetylase RimI-like enzyme